MRISVLQIIAPLLFTYFIPVRQVLRPTVHAPSGEHVSVANSYNNSDGNKLFMCECLV
jgi:hypothetical protein